MNLIRFCHHKLYIITKAFLSSVAILISLAFSVIAMYPIFELSLRRFLFLNFVHNKIFKFSEIIDYFEINYDGLLGTFFENVKNEKLTIKSENTKPTKNLNITNVGLYVITFNSPNQLRTLIQSMSEYDNDFIKLTKKFLLDNSTDLSTAANISVNFFCKNNSPALPA